VDAALVADIRAQAEAWAQATASPAVGVIGISFSGGLALMAAAEQAAKRPIGFVASVGGHADLLRVCAYYAGRDVRGPDGEPPAVAPHPYGARVMLRGHLASLVSPSDLPGALEALDTYLHDKPHAAQRLAEKLSPDARKVMDVLLDEGGSDTLSTWLMQVAHSHRQQLLAASPHGHLAGLKVPVLLLHGSSDPVVPSIETRYLAREVPAAAQQVVLITDLLRHADFPQAPAPSQAYRLARFMQRLLGVAGGMAAASQR
jgi:pimeloyl-ACP methyl ester carboxylesterase